MWPQNDQPVPDNKTYCDRHNQVSLRELPVDGTAHHDDTSLLYATSNEGINTQEMEWNRVMDPCYVHPTSPVGDLHPATNMTSGQPGVGSRSGGLIASPASSIGSERLDDPLFVTADPGLQN